uniref:Uncharacterized protein LOC103333067 n=1 Tax=Rhizophora mucronata TaxID=61149 RepID=A0A2P2KN43_RHIMU
MKSSVHAIAMDDTSNGPIEPYPLPRPFPTALSRPDLQINCPS